MRKLFCFVFLCCCSFISAGDLAKNRWVSNNGLMPMIVTSHIVSTEIDSSGIASLNIFKQDSDNITLNAVSQFPLSVHPIMTSASFGRVSSKDDLLDQAAVIIRRQEREKKLLKVGMYSSFVLGFISSAIVYNVIN